MELFTPILIGLILVLSIFMFAIWTHKNFLNFIVKISFLTAAILSIGIGLNDAGIANFNAVPIHVYMWINVFFFGLLGMTWSTKGGLNLFLKFSLILTTFGIATWLFIF